MERTFARLYVVKSRWLVKVEKVLVSSVNEIIEGQFDDRLVVVVAWRGNAGCNCRTDYFRGPFQILGREAAVNIWRVVDLVLNLSKGIKVSALQSYNSASRFRASFWINFCDLWPVVIVIKQSRRGILSTVLRD